MEQFDEALADYERAIRLEPENAAFLGNRALTLNNLGRSEEAVTELDRAIELNDTSYVLYANRAWIHYELKCCDEARQDCESALQNAAKDEDVTDIQDLLERLEPKTGGSHG